MVWMLTAAVLLLTATTTHLAILLVVVVGLVPGVELPLPIQLEGPSWQIQYAKAHAKICVAQRGWVGVVGGGWHCARRWASQRWGERGRER
jgi:hypothetical protein